jgi:hypothetical protein
LISCGTGTTAASAQLWCPTRALSISAVPNRCPLTFMTSITKERSQTKRRGHHDVASTPDCNRTVNATDNPEESLGISEDTVTREVVRGVLLKICAKVARVVAVDGTSHARPRAG